MSEYIILILAGLDLCGASTLTPFLPVIAETMGASTLEISFLLSLYAVCQVIFGPIIGSFSDGFGRVFSLQISFLGSALTGVFIAILFYFENQTHYWLYIAIIPMAVLRHAQV